MTPPVAMILAAVMISVVVISKEPLECIELETDVGVCFLYWGWKYCLPLDQGPA